MLGLSIDVEPENWGIMLRWVSDRGLEQRRERRSKGCSRDTFRTHGAERGGGAWCDDGPASGRDEDLVTGITPPSGGDAPADNNAASPLLSPVPAGPVYMTPVESPDAKRTILVCPPPPPLAPAVPLPVPCVI